MFDSFIKTVVGDLDDKRAYVPNEAPQKDHLNKTIREQLPKEDKPC